MTILSTRNAIRNTILHDTETYLWFRHLILLRTLRREIQPLVPQTYRRLQIYDLRQTILLTTGIWSCVLALELRSPIPVVVGLVTGIAWVLGRRGQRAQVAEAAIQAIDRDYPNGGFQTMSLFQITERYARNYGLPSFVGQLTATEQAGRMGLIVVCLVLTYIVPWSFGETMAALALGVPVFVIINRFLYRHTSPRKPPMRISQDAAPS